MRLMGFNFTKISAERVSDNFQNLKINTEINVSEIKEAKSSFFKIKEEILGVKFDYNVNYEPDIAKLSFSGNLVVSLDSKEAKEVLKQWKTKKIPENFKLNVFNIILRKSTLRSLQLEEELNLPSHTPLPSIKPPEKKE